LKTSPEASLLSCKQLNNNDILTVLNYPRKTGQSSFNYSIKQ
jgi:hypothetical protein